MIEEALSNESLKKEASLFRRLSINTSVRLALYTVFFNPYFALTNCPRVTPSWLVAFRLFQTCVPEISPRSARL